MDAYLPSTLFIGGALQIVGAAVYYRVIRSWEKEQAASDNNGYAGKDEIPPVEK